MNGMNRRRFLAMAAAGPAVARARAKRPNVVLILADDMGSGDLSSYGAADIRTPNIDGIGRRGVRFTRFYDNAPECTPTRTALLTGRYQQRVGGLECAIGVNNVGRYDEAVWLQQRGELGLPAAETSLARMLKEAGYDTGCFGKWHLGYEEKFSPNQHGFDEYFGILGGNANYFTHEEEGGHAYLYRNGERVKRQGYLTDLFTGEAVGWLKARGPRPFFLYLPYNAPHVPIQDPDGADSATGTAPVRQGDRKIYARMVERMDRGVGEVLDQIERMGVGRDTLVLFLSDNGADPNGSNAPLRGRKSSLWEGGIRAPLVARWPGVLPEGREVAQVSLTMDLAPTVLAAVGARAPAGRRLDGENLMPIMQGRRGPWRRTVFWRYKRGNVVRKAVRDGDLKYVLDGDREELHDLASDEREQKDLMEASPGLAEPLRRKLAAWEREVEAPRLREFRKAAG